MDIKYIDLTVDRPTLRLIKKSVWNGTEWEVIQFYELKLGLREIENLKQWLIKHYGSPKYSKSWWLTYDSAVLQEKIYTHWKLCE